MTFQLTDGQVDRGPDSCDGKTLVGIVLDASYTFQSDHATASDVTAHEVSGGGYARLSGDATSDLVTDTGIRTVYLEDVTSTTTDDIIGGVAWFLPGASDSLRKYVGYSADPTPAGTYEPAYPDGLFTYTVDPGPSNLTDLGDVQGLPANGEGPVWSNAEGKFVFSAASGGESLATVGTIVYNPTTPTSANNYETWDEVMAIVDQVHGSITIHIETDATIPTGTYSLPPFTKFSGSGVDWFGPGGATLTLEDGVTFEGLTTLLVENGLLLLASNTTDPVWTPTAGTPFLFTQTGGSIANEGTEVILDASACSVAGVQADTGGRLLNGTDDESPTGHPDVGTYELLKVTAADVVVIGLTLGTTHASDDLVRGSCGVLYNLIGSPGVQHIPTHANLTVSDATFDAVKSKAGNISVAATATNVSPATADVEAWLVALDAASGGGGGGGSVATDSVWTAKGDIAVGTGSNSADNVPHGTDGQVLTSDSTEATFGLRWTTLTASSVSAAPTSRTITAGTGLSGGGDLTANRTLSIDTATVVDKTTAQTLTNKTLTAPAISSPTGIVKADVGLGSVTNDAQLKIASNLSDLASASTARTNLGLGTLAVANYAPGAVRVVAASRTVGSTVIATPIVPVVNGATTLAIALGDQYFTRAYHSGQTLTTLGILVSATSLTGSQTVEVSCYNDLDDWTPGTRRWTQSITVGTSTGWISASSLSLAMPAGPCWISVLNPSGNAGTVTLRTGTPTMAPAHTQMAAGTFTPVWKLTSVASATSDASAYTIRSSSTGSGVYGVDASTTFPIVGALA